jgi:hypothetical protein
MFPLLTGFSVFCLVNPRSPDFTRVFGGSNGNEGLGVLSVCLDWQYISGGTNPFAIPLRAQVHESVLELCRTRADMFFPVLQLDRIFIVHVSPQPRFILIITELTIQFPERVVFVSVYYNNIWKSKSFPFVGYARSHHCPH